MLLVVPLIFLWSVSAQTPPNPCPQYITYRFIRQHPEILLTIPNDRTGMYLLNVTASVPFFTNESIKIEVENYQDLTSTPVDYLKYILRYNFEEFPLITKIIFNGKELCRAEPYSAADVGAVTNFRIYYMLQSSIQKQISQFDYQNYWQISNSPRITKVPSTTSYAPTVTSRWKEEGIACGQVDLSRPLIIQGNEVLDGEFPWLSALFYYSKNDRKYVYHCVGNLISQKHILTAAHCFVHYNFFIFEKEQIIAVLGKSNLENYLLDSKIASIGKIDLHPNYEQNHAGHNLALLTLSNLVEFTRFIKPVCLPNGIHEMKEGTVAGWGKTFPEEAYSMDAKKINMPMVSQQDCLRSHATFLNLTSKETFCAGSRNHRGPCIGDSGAGFFIKNGEAYYLKGIVSYTLATNHTCDLGNYIVFVDISKEENWIKQAMNE